MSGVGTLLCTVVGLLLTSASIFETWMAVLYPRAVSGPITAFVYRIYHNVSQKVLGPKSKLLLFSGPVLIVTQATVWATLLLLGVSLMVWPQLGMGIVSSGTSETDASFATAVYYAGFSVTTLGVGDLVPQTMFAQIVTITAARSVSASSRWFWPTLFRSTAHLADAISSHLKSIIGREELGTRWRICDSILRAMIVHYSIKTCATWHPSWPTFSNRITSIRHCTTFVSASQDTR